MPHLGYTDGKLEMLSTVHGVFEPGIAPWATWESENSSFGKTFRKWTKYPKIFPLFFCSDHGVHHLGSRCWPNETESRLKTFFTWNKKKSKLMRKDHGKNSFHVSHPWTFYRNKYFPTLPDDRKGTLVFFAHSNVKTTPVYENLDKYMSDLKSLPEKFKPVVICLSFHDINKGLHKELRKYDIPLVTAGTTNSQKFVDRFYSLTYKFRFSSSPNIGSHTFYLIEAGIPFFLFGPYPEYHIKGSKAVKDGKQNTNDYGDEEDLAEFMRLKKLLSEPTDEVTSEQYALVSKYLGMDSEMTRFKASMLIWREFFLHFDECIKSYARLVPKLIAKINSLIFSKKNNELQQHK